MSIYVPRELVYDNIISFPATKSAGALTISSDPIKVLEDKAFGPVELVIKAADSSKITNTLTIRPYVSFDGGSSWLYATAAAYTELANGTGSITAYKSVLSVAPRVKVEAIFNGSGSLASGHGCAVNAYVKEADENFRKKIKPNCLSVGTSVAQSTTLTSSALSANTDVPQIRKVYMCTYCADLTKITNTVTYTLESSNDGTNWWTASASGSDIAAGSGVLHSVTAITDGSTYYLGKYVRVKLVTGTGAAIASGHGIQFNLVLCY